MSDDAPKDDPSVIAEDDEEISHGPCKDGSKVYRYKSGKKKYVMRDGTTLVISTEGIKTQRNPDKKIIQLFPDGRKTTKNPDGTMVEKLINGDVVTRRTDNTTITVYKVPFGDNQVTKKTEHPDGTVTESHKTGLKTAIFPARRRLPTTSLPRKMLWKKLPSFQMV